jgi:hypothetical protein
VKGPPDLDRAPVWGHIPQSFKGLNPRIGEENGMLPGGYDFIHLVFWTVVAMVALGTNFMALTLSAGIGLLLLEALGKR